MTEIKGHSQKIICMYMYIHMSARYDIKGITNTLRNVGIFRNDQMSEKSIYYVCLYILYLQKVPLHVSSIGLLHQEYGTSRHSEVFCMYPAHHKFIMCGEEVIILIINEWSHQGIWMVSITYVRLTLSLRCKQFIMEI